MLMLNSKYLEEQEMMWKLKTMNREKLDSGILSSSISQGPTALCQASQLPTGRELGTQAANYPKLDNHSASL